MRRVLLSFGHGYSAQALSRRLLPEGWRIIGTTRSADKADALAAQGIEPVIWPGTDMTPYIEEANFLLTSAAPGEDGDPVLAEWRDTIAENAGNFRWIGYLSTTGVYGDHDGGWVDEETGLTPTTKRGKQRVQAEGEWWHLAKEHTLPLSLCQGQERHGAANREAEPGVFAHPCGGHRAGAGRVHRGAAPRSDLQCLRRPRRAARGRDRPCGGASGSASATGRGLCDGRNDANGA